MYSAILISHIVISILLILLLLYIVIRSFFGVMGKVSFSKFQDIQLSIVAVIFLYLELILGILLYAIYINKLETLITQANANAYFSARFWAVEHAILMFFAIIFGHLGLVYAKNLSEDKQKFQKNLLYFGLSSVLIFISITMNMLRNA
ncbi:MAG TPA: hypothetical protein EYG01_01560 [Flavobacteriales bacterium]|jgi:hypothetical protein|nr:hypothetical protein [Flavobacteriales bacterium]